MTENDGIYKRTKLSFNFNRIKDLITENHGINIFNIMVVSFIFRFLICFMFGTEDLPRYTYVGSYLIYGLNPYTDHIDFPIDFYNKYPPLFFELLSGWFLIFGNSVFSLRILLLVCDMGVIYVLYQIGKLIKNKETGLVFSSVYAFLPITFMTFLAGENDAIPILFMTISIYFFLKDRIKLSSLFIGLGICFKIFPLFAYFGYLIYYIKKGKIKQTIISLSIVFLVFLATSAPFLILSPGEYIKSIMVHASRRNTGVQFTNLVPFLFTDINLNIFGLIIPISYNFIVQLLILGIFSFYFLLSKNRIEKKDGILWALIYLILLPLLMYRGNVGNWAWTSPFLIIYVFYNRSNFLEKNKKLIIFTLVGYICVIVSGFIYTNTIPFSIFSTYANMPNIEYLIDNDKLFTVGLPLLLVMILSYPISGIIFLRKKNRSIILAIIGFMNFTDPEIYYFMLKFWGQIDWLIISELYLIIRIALILYMTHFVHSNKEDLRILSKFN